MFLSETLRKPRVFEGSHLISGDSCANTFKIRDIIDVFRSFRITCQLWSSLVIRGTWYIMMRRDVMWCDNVSCNIVWWYMIWSDVARALCAVVWSYHVMWCDAANKKASNCAQQTRIGCKWTHNQSQNVSMRATKYEPSNQSKTRRQGQASRDKANNHASTQASRPSKHASNQSREARKDITMQIKQSKETQSKANTL